MCITRLREHLRAQAWAQPIAAISAPSQYHWNDLGASTTLPQIEYLLDVKLIHLVAAYKLLKWTCY